MTGLAGFAIGWWVVIAALVLRPAPEPTGSLPLAIVWSALNFLPAVVGVAALIRWTRTRAREATTSPALAIRWATLLSIAAVASPLFAFTVPWNSFEAAYRLSEALCLSVFLDGPVMPSRESERSTGARLLASIAAPRSTRTPSAPARSTQGQGPASPR
jgi:hypothetical protein